MIKSRENPTQRATTIEDTAADTSPKGPLAAFQVSEDPTLLCLSSLVDLSTRPSHRRIASRPHVRFKASNPKNLIQTLADE